jgi:hypothetical protein
MVSELPIVCYLSESPSAPEILNVPLVGFLYAV